MSVVAGWGLQLGATLERVNDISQVPESSGSPDPRPPAGHRLDVRNLTFAYSPTATPVLEDFDLTVEEGEHLAILGTSGIGKSTLANLLSGLLHGHRGQVTIGAVPLSNIATGQLRTQVAVIPQESYVFDGTLREKLTYLRPDATDTDIDDTIAALQLGALVDRIGGHEARFTAGDIHLSQGERQLIALARVYLSPASVVILDEAMCHLDPHTEAIAELAFTRRPGTLIVIAHRITSALRANRIILLDGTRVSHGTHDELMETSPQYRRLVSHWRPGG